jgi:hypothetical protein
MKVENVKTSTDLEAKKIDGIKNVDSIPKTKIETVIVPDKIPN